MLSDLRTINISAQVLSRVDEPKLIRILADLPQGAIVRSAYTEPGFEADVFQKGINDYWCQTGWNEELTTVDVARELLRPFKSHSLAVVGYVIWW